MKNRVEGFLKVTRQRVLDTEPKEVMWNMNDLYNKLIEIIRESGDANLAMHLESEWNQIWLEHKIQKWDEEFLKVIANDEPAPRTLAIDTGFGYADHKVEGQPTTLLTSASMHQVAHDILKKHIDTEFKKDYAKIQMKNRYKTP